MYEHVSSDACRPTPTPAPVREETLGQGASRMTGFANLALLTFVAKMAGAPVDTDAIYSGSPIRGKFIDLREYGVIWPPLIMPCKFSFAV